MANRNDPRELGRAIRERTIINGISEKPEPITSIPGITPDAEGNEHPLNEVFTDFAAILTDEQYSEFKTFRDRVRSIYDTAQRRAHQSRELAEALRRKYRYE